MFAGAITYTVDMNGANEAPSNGSPATGSATVIIDDVLHTLYISMSFTGLVGTTTASYIHCCTAAADTGTAGVATQTPRFIGFPTGVTSGAYTNTFDMTLASTWNPAFITAQGGVANAEAALEAHALAGEAYLNVHTTVLPGGEIRGFLVPTPEPGTFLLAGLALAGVVLRRKRS